MAVDINMKRPSAQQEVALRIVEFFPSSRLDHKAEQPDEVFEIYVDNNLLLLVDAIGIHFMFPIPNSKTMKWSSILEGGPKEVADFVLRSLDRAGFQTTPRQRSNKKY